MYIYTYIYIVLTVIVKIGIVSCRLSKTIYYWCCSNNIVHNINSSNSHNTTKISTNDTNNNTLYDSPMKNGRIEATIMRKVLMGMVEETIISWHMVTWYVFVEWNIIWNDQMTKSEPVKPNYWPRSIPQLIDITLANSTRRAGENATGGRDSPVAPSLPLVQFQRVRFVLEFEPNTLQNWVTIRFGKVPNMGH